MPELDVWEPSAEPVVKGSAFDSEVIGCLSFCEEPRERTFRELLHGNPESMKECAKLR
jgi:hypothetical protein